MLSAHSLQYAQGHFRTLTHLHAIEFSKFHPFLPGSVIKPLLCIVIVSHLDVFALQVFFPPVTHL